MKRFVKLVLSTVALGLFLSAGAHAQSYTAAEQRCFDMVQGKVAYDRAGNMVWNDVNVRRLCQGTTDPVSRIECFKRKIAETGDWSRGISECTATPQVPNGTTVFDIPTYQPLRGTWDVYNSDGSKIAGAWTVTQSAAGVSFQDLSGATNTFSLKIYGLELTGIRNGTLSVERDQINWSDGTIFLKRGSRFKANLPKPNPPRPDSGMTRRSITLRNSAGFYLKASLHHLSQANLFSTKSRTVGDDAGYISPGRSETFAGDVELPAGDLVELELILKGAVSNFTFFKARLPRNKEVKSFCYAISGTYFDPIVKTCDGSPLYEHSYIAFRNEGLYDASMGLVYYALRNSEMTTVRTPSTSAGFKTKIYLPIEVNPNLPMKIRVDMDATVSNYLDKPVTVGDFDSVGTTCYKTWGTLVNAKVSKCALDPNARTVKFWNAGGYPAKLVVDYFDKDSAGRDVLRSVETNFIDTAVTETIDVPMGKSTTPVRISVVNKWGGANGRFFNMNVRADFTGELCYKSEGTTFAPVASTCDNTVGDTTGKTRQIKFLNDSGFDSEMIVMYFVDETINGVKMSMPKVVSSGMINGLGKFRLVTIPENTSKGSEIFVSFKGAGTLRNDIWSTKLPSNFAASPQQCFKVWGTLFDPQAGKCDQ